MQGKRKKTKKQIAIKQPDTIDLEPCTLHLVPLPTGRCPCPDCHFCQACSQDRCRLCRSSSLKKTRKKLTMAEQIALYERINKKEPGRKK